MYYPLIDPIKYFNESLFFLIPIYCLLLFFLQNSNFNLVKSYLHLPISRDNIIAYLLIKKFINVINLCLVLFIVPFAWVNVLPNYGWFSFLLYLFSFFSVLVIITYFTYLLKLLSYKHIYLALFPILWIILSFIIKLIPRMEFREFIAGIFTNILNRNFLTVGLIVLLAVSMTCLNLLMIKHLIYNIFTYDTRNKLKIRPSPKKLFPRIKNPYILLEIDLILRNKRISSMFIIPIYLIILTYVLFLSKPINDTYTVLFWYLCLSGIWGYSYLQYVFTFEGCFFDFISTSKFDIYKYLKTKYTLIILLSFLLITIISPIIIISKQDIHLIATAFLYNIGIGFFIVFLTATYNREKLDLSSSLFFNYKGYNPIQIITISLAILTPIAFISIVTILISQFYGLIILNILSIISLIYYKKWFSTIYKQLLKRKYINLEGFRQ